MTTPSRANETQVGGRHYRDLAIQPWDYAAANGLDPFAAAVVKYVTRYGAKHGVEDLRKARHYLDKLIELVTQFGYPATPIMPAQVVALLHTEPDRDRGGPSGWSTSGLNWSAEAEVDLGSKSPQESLAPSDARRLKDAGTQFAIDRTISVFLELEKELDTLMSLSRPDIPGHLLRSAQRVSQGRSAFLSATAVLTTPTEEPSDE